MRGAIVLAGGQSRRLGRPKALVAVRGVPLVVRVVRAAREVADQVVVVSRGGIAAQLERVLPFGVRLVRDRRRLQSPLVGLVTGASALRSPYVLSLGCDQPFLVRELLAALFARARGHDAAVPRRPNGMIEPLLAVYRRTAILRAALGALEADERSNQAMLDRMRDVRFVPVADLRRFDARGRSFVNVNTREDLARAERMR